jgi:hypothetical protein
MRLDHRLHVDLARKGPAGMERGRSPKSGEVWPEAERKLWLDLLAASFKLIDKDGSLTGPQILRA